MTKDEGLEYVTLVGSLLPAFWQYNDRSVRWISSELETAKQIYEAAENPNVKDVGRNYLAIAMAAKNLFFLQRADLLVSYSNIVATALKREFKGEGPERLQAVAAILQNPETSESTIANLRLKNSLGALTGAIDQNVGRLSFIALVVTFTRLSRTELPSKFDGKPLLEYLKKTVGDEIAKVDLVSTLKSIQDFANALSASMNAAEEIKQLAATDKARAKRQIERIKRHATQTVGFAYACYLTTVAIGARDGQTDAGAKKLDLPATNQAFTREMRTWISAFSSAISALEEKGHPISDLI